MVSAPFLLEKGGTTTWTPWHDKCQTATDNGIIHRKINYWNNFYSITCLHGSARQVVIGHVTFKGKRPIFSTPQSQHHWRDQHQTWYIWLPRPYHQSCRFWLRSDRRGRLGIGVKYTLFSFSVFFSYFSPSDPISTSKYGPIFVVDTSNDVFPCVYEPPLQTAHVKSILGGHWLQTPPHFGKNVTVCDLRTKMDV